MNAGIPAQVPRGTVHVPQFSLPDYVLRYCNDVKTRYVQQSILPDSDWPPSLGGQYVRLALIHQERQLHNYTYESVVEQQIDYTRGDYDKIMEHKTKIELIKAFEEIVCDGDNVLTLKMLIDGAVGVGKTTLSRKVSSMWAKGEILPRYWLVLLLHLREKDISKAKTIDELFDHEDGDLQQSVVKYVKERSGDGVLIIFDGFDELTTYERSEDSLFLDICKGNVLPKCAVAITSRPCASRFLQELPVINRHIEVLGFTDEQVRVCIMKKIKDQAKAEDLCIELKDRPDVASICQIPLNCSIVLYVYEQENYRLPRTLTKLYELFVLHSVKRFLKRTHKAEVAHRLLTLKKLKSPHNTNLLALCKLSFEGLKNNKLVFPRNELVQKFFPEHQESDMDLPVLDLMTSAKSYSCYGAHDTYSFLHSSIQEFLAAHWIAYHLSDDEFLQQNLMESRFRMVALFLSGLTKLEFPHASRVFNQEYWNDDAIIILSHLTYEAGDRTLCEDVCKGCCNPFTFESIELTGSKFDKLVTSTFIAQSNYQWKEFRIKYDDIKIVHEVFSSVCSGTSIENTFVTDFSSENGEHNLVLLKSLDELPQLDRVHFVVDISGKSEQLVHDLKMIQDLNNFFTGRLAKRYCIELAAPSDQKIYTCTLQRDKMLLRFCKTLGKCLVQNTSLIEVHLFGVFANHVMCIISSLNERDSVPNLERLVCDGVFLVETRGEQVPFQEFCTTLKRFISHNPCTSLKELHLEVFVDRDLNKIGIDAIASALQDNPTLQKLTLTAEELFFERNCETETMELKCSNEYKTELSLQPSVTLKGSNNSYRRRLINKSFEPPPVPSDVENGSPIGQPCITSSPQSVSDNTNSWLPTVSLSHQSEVNTRVSISSQSSVLESSLDFESNPTSPLQEPYPVSPGTSCQFTSYQTDVHVVSSDLSVSQQMISTELPSLSSLKQPQTPAHAQPHSANLSHESYPAPRFDSAHLSYPAPRFDSAHLSYPAPQFDSAHLSYPTPRFDSAHLSYPTPRFDSAHLSYPAPQFDSAHLSYPAPRFDSAHLSYPAPRFDSAHLSYPAPQFDSAHLSYPTPRARFDRAHLSYPAPRLDSAHLSYPAPQFDSAHLSYPTPRARFDRAHLSYPAPRFGSGTAHHSDFMHHHATSCDHTVTQPYNQASVSSLPISSQPQPRESIHHRPNHGCIVSDLPQPTCRPVNLEISARAPTAGSVSISDLCKVQRCTWEARTKWYNIGLELNIHPETLSVIESDNGKVNDRFTAMLITWLRTKPTLSALADALRSPTVGYDDVADQVHQLLQC